VAASTRGGKYAIGGASVWAADRVNWTTCTVLKGAEYFIRIKPVPMSGPFQIQRPSRCGVPIDLDEMRTVV
jgi:hypothetical protein